MLEELEFACVMLRCLHFSSLVHKLFTNPLEMQHSIELLEAIQQTDLNSFWSAHTYSKVIKASLLALEQTDAPDSLSALATKVL